MRIWFLRHGQSVANERGLFAGQRENSPLTETGLMQARAAAEDLRAKGVVLREIIYSPLKRTHQTAAEVQGVLEITDELMRTDERIMEYDMGEYTNTPIRPIPSIEFTSGKDAENPDLFKSRVLSFMQEMLGKPEGDYLVVSHGGVGRCIEAMKREMPANSFYDLPVYPNAEAVLLELDWLERFQELAA
jgi:alpha-ribazole phosphatase